MPILKDRVAIVTGASAGIGRATALLFTKEGARVVVAARRRPALESLVEEIGRARGEAVAVAGDVCDESFAQEMVETAKRAFGGLDIAFNNAGTIGPMAATDSVSRSAWDETLATNPTSAFLCAKHQLPAMLARGGGSIVFTSTFVGHTVGFPGVAAYAASKAGLIGLTQVLAAEYAQRGIRVNALLPGGTDTAMARTMNPTEEAIAGVRQLHALKRIATPEEQAKSALYLASDASSFTTGIALLSDGGVSINRS